VSARFSEPGGRGRRFRTLLVRYQATHRPIGVLILWDLQLPSSASTYLNSSPSTPGVRWAGSTPSVIFNVGSSIGGGASLTLWSKFRQAFAVKFAPLSFTNCRGFEIRFTPACNLKTPSSSSTQISYVAFQYRGCGETSTVLHQMMLLFTGDFLVTVLTKVIGISISSFSFVVAVAYSIIFL